MQIDTDRSAAAVDKSALLNRTVLCPPQANQRIGFVMHFPVVLEPGVVGGNRVPLAMREGQPAKAKVPHGLVSRALLVDLAFTRINSVSRGATTGESFRGQR